MSKTTFLFGMLIGAIAVGVREIAFATMAPIQETGQRLAMSSTGRAALNGTFQVPYSSDQGNNDPALDPGIPGDGNMVAYKDTPTTIMLCFFRRGVGWRKIQLNTTGVVSGASGGTPAVVLGTSGVAGVSTTFLRDDDTIAAFDTTAPTTAAFSDTAAVGSAAFAARRDHLHGMMSSGTLSSLTVTGTLTLTGGTVTGAPTWGANQAITLSTAAQPNVTSLGTLTGLTVQVATGDISLFYSTQSGNDSIIRVRTNKADSSAGIALDNSAGGVNTLAGMRVAGTTLSFVVGGSSGQSLYTSNEKATLDSSGNWTQKGKTTNYNNVATVGLGVPALYGIDNRTGLTGADGAATTMYTTVAANNIFRVSADIFATAAVTGTATYTIAWTENATGQTMAVTATAVNTLGTASNLIRPDSGTTITARLTGVFTGTFTVVGLVEQVA